MSILTLIGLCVLLIARINAISDEMKQMAQAMHDSCVEETGVEEKFIEDCRNGVFAEDDNLKCYMKCLLTRVSMMTEDGNIDVDMIIDMMPEEYKDIAVPVLRACGTAKGSNDCETAFLTNKCWHSKNPENYYLV